MADLASQLSQIIAKENILTDPGECIAYGYDNSRHHGLPLAVVLAANESDIIQLIQFCNQEKIPLYPRGRGTGTTGGSVPLKPGIVLSCERMDKILKIDPANRMMIVEPGVLNQTIQNKAAEHGFFWAPDPSSSAYCTVGGNLACNAAGPRAVKYGTCRENTLGLSAITGSGLKIKTGTQTTKGVVGLDLTRLLIGSEGILGVITQAILKLTPLPETKTMLKAIFSDIASASLAVSQIMAQAITPSALEFMDAKAIAMIRDYAAIELPKNAGALLMIEIDGSKTALAESVAAIRQAATNEGLITIEAANNQEQMDSMWKLRKALSPALKNVAPKKINEDVVVPVANIPALITGIDKFANEYKINIINFGHAGNGNIHVNLLVNPDDIDENQRAYACLKEIFTLVLKLNGSLSGEHGVGIEKRDFIIDELDANALQLMHQIKQQFDPNNIMNPGKALP